MKSGNASQPSSRQPTTVKAVTPTPWRPLTGLRHWVKLGASLPSRPGWAVICCPPLRFKYLGKTLGNLGYSNLLWARDISSATNGKSWSGEFLTVSAFWRPTRGACQISLNALREAEATRSKFNPCSGSVPLPGRVSRRCASALRFIAASTIAVSEQPNLKPAFRIKRRS